LRNHDRAQFFTKLNRGILRLGWANEEPRCDPAGSQVIDTDTGYFVNSKFARWTVPSFSFTTTWRQLFAQPLSVFLMYV
jgi:hypothetical protein